MTEHGYRVFRLNYEGRTYRIYAHVVAYALDVGHTDFGELDHRNVAPADNRPRNLRPATRQQNSSNRNGWAKTGLPKGVTAVRGRFRASGSYDGRTHQIGTFDTPAEAHAAFCAWAKPLRGEFFNPGPPKPTVFD